VNLRISSRWLGLFLRNARRMKVHYTKREKEVASVTGWKMLRKKRF
jgi:hypothetical protein